jgi:sodium-dependent dicarboxylate transporter 2/3/5|tara:strand:+ start:732 stop:2273 length:1542 start_codon:yes stop_codon:yes gene_type:complete
MYQKPTCCGENTMKKAGLLLGPTLFCLVVFFADLDPQNPKTTIMAGIALLMATWWLTEAIPLFATALIPLILYPVLGIEKGANIAPIYFNSTIVLFIGGFLIALVMQKWDLHRRIALTIIATVGGGASRIVLGFMLASAFLSMWISNTATATMMLPIGLSVILELEKQFHPNETTGFSTGVMLGIGYSCSIGGISTLVGTPPNLAFARISQISFPDSPAVSFGQWLTMALPITITLLVIAWLLITKVFFRVPNKVKVDNSIVEKQKRLLGTISYEEKVVLTVFSLTVLLWIFRAPINLGLITIPGWSGLLPFPGLVDDGTIAITMATLFFLIPSRNPKSGSGFLADAELIPKLPWNIVLLYGGGFALAHGFVVSGLASLLGSKLSIFAGLTPFLLIALVCFSMTFLTEVTSNTATTEMILPILAAVAVATGLHPFMLMIPATISASCAFMMPVATPPNAIIFGSNRVRVPDMARIGIWLNLVGVLVVAATFYFVGQAIFDINPDIMPGWARFE